MRDEVDACVRVMLFPVVSFLSCLQGKDLWLQGMITLETVYVEYRADVHVFDHHVHERFHYQVNE